MKKIVGIIVVLVVLFSGCSSKPPSKGALAAAKKMLKSFTVLMTKTVGEMKKATTAVQAGDVLVSYAKALAKKTLEIDALKKKYPDFDNAAKDGSLTKEAKILQKTVGELNVLYTTAEKKYKDDEDFAKSLKDMKKIIADAEKKPVPAKVDDKGKKVKVGIKKSTPVAKKITKVKKTVVK